MNRLESVKNAIWSMIAVGISAFITIKITHLVINDKCFWLYLLLFTFVVSYVLNVLRNPHKEPDGTLVVVDTDNGADLGLSLYINVDELKKRGSVDFDVKYSGSQHKQ
jgi:hypothetical protein